MQLAQGYTDMSALGAVETHQEVPGLYTCHSTERPARLAGTYTAQIVNQESMLSDTILGACRTSWVNMHFSNAGGHTTCNSCCSL